jgi:hypothetical protein
VRLEPPFDTASGDDVTETLKLGDKLRAGGHSAKRRP